MQQSGVIRLHDSKYNTAILNGLFTMTLKEVEYKQNHNYYIIMYSMQPHTVTLL